MSNEYPALGFDPAPGSVQSVQDLHSKLSKAATGLEHAQQTLRSITHGGKTWQGDAANAFAEKVGDLPKYVSDSYEALRTAATKLSGWQNDLSHYQQKAREYEASAKRVKGQEEQAETAHEQASSAYNRAAADPSLRLAGQTFTDQAQLQHAQSQLDAANRRLNDASRQLDHTSGQLQTARDELQRIINKAKELLETHQSNARAIASALEKANDKAPDTGFWESLGDAFSKLGREIQDWCAENKDLLKTVGDWLSIGSTVMGVLSLCTLWCPPLSGAFALAGGALSLGALAAHGAAKLGGANVSTMDLVGDGLGVIPFGKFGSTLLKGSTKVALNTTKVGEATVSSVDDVAKITRLNRLGSEAAEGIDFARHAAEGGGRAFKAAGGLGNRAKLAWESHVADTIGSSFKEKRISDLLTSNWSPLKDVDSFKSAIRADGSLDPLSMWSKGPQLVGSAPGIVTGVYDQVTGKD